jgi:hypothetical protein
MVQRLLPSTDDTNRPLKNQHDPRLGLAATTLARLLHLAARIFAMSSVSHFVTNDHPLLSVP